VASGRRPHDLTVDLIYAEIKQGSRTTINDELKLWKDEQAKADALTTALPPAVSNAMLNMWAIAVEHGEKVFDQQREEAENQLAQAIERFETLNIEKNKLTQQIEGLQSEFNQGQAELDASGEMLAIERTAKDAANARSIALEQQLESAKADSAQAIIILKTEHQHRVEELQASLAAQEIAFRQEIDKATERLEGVQKHVMLQVAEARETQKRAEALLAKANQKNEQLSADLQQFKSQTALLTQTSERTQNDLAKAHAETTRLQAERELLIQQLGTANGKLGALSEQNKSLERRAAGAETRLEEALKRPAAKKRVVKHHQQDLIKS
jgi:chromosome segregation ATPase